MRTRHGNKTFGALLETFEASTPLAHPCTAPALYIYFKSLHNIVMYNLSDGTNWCNLCTLWFLRLSKVNGVHWKASWQQLPLGPLSAFYPQQAGSVLLDLCMCVLPKAMWIAEISQEGTRLCWFFCHSYTSFVAHHMEHIRQGLPAAAAWPEMREGGV